MPNTQEGQPGRTDVNTLGEFGLIHHLTKAFPIRNASTIKGVGDDAAVIDNRGLQTVVSTDMLVEGIHFDLGYTPLRHLGYKSVIVNLSDIYAMNAQPRQITVSVALSNRFSVEAMEEIYAGIHKACEIYGVDLVGGDTTSSPRGLVISVTAIGQAKKEQLVYRSGARPGDLLCITGNLGAAYMGLQILEREKQIYLSDPNIQPNLEGHDYLIERQLKPEARRDMIEAFAKAGLLPTAMIDISDGLASELHHICQQSGVGVLLEESGVPIHQDAQFQAIDFNLDPITVALSGGEDYELLFTIDPKDVDKVKYMPDLYIAGEVTPADDGLKLNSKGGKLHEITAQGWVHFKPNA
ncbi:thiamine-phosphate kinase [Phaeodactylibacter luteus]|uniref:Thiamine-monophosphate kinase n=1 Tax=Phaeodactylibacter luteus TaxID=1564516 RepID=A0A5C6RJR5_9BACT|nr:thiamine-phosphate kinase [Phaeodactylibacter luteus]TXB62159.1 thiamine-phosphate kinase [Phaeodactylibacter luteus]